MEMDLFEKALVFAMEKHHGAKRKASDIPFILHPMEVAVIASTMSEDEVLLAAALLHDTVEDTDATLSSIASSRTSAMKFWPWSQVKPKTNGRALRLRKHG